jgi:hypothetical protein
MTSQKKIEANRRNALKSTGPKTPKGKAKVSKNALKHGLLSNQVLLPEEDKVMLENFASRIRSELAPAGELEFLLVDRIITSSWRIRRLLGVEVGIYEEEESPKSFEYGESRSMGDIFDHVANTSDAFSKLSRYESAIERSLYRALHELQRLQADRAGEAVPVPAVLDVTMDGSNTAE